MPVPVPVPWPEPMPVPWPVPMPVPWPVPMPVPVPVPMPQPVPMPVPIPMPMPMPEPLPPPLPLPTPLPLPLPNPPTTAHALVVTSDACSPAWRASVEGVETRIYRANVLGRAVVVPPAEHEAVHRCDDAPLRPGTLATAGAARGWARLLAASLRSGARRPQCATLGPSCPSEADGC